MFRVTCWRNDPPSLAVLCVHWYSYSRIDEKCIQFSQGCLCHASWNQTRQRLPPLQKAIYICSSDVGRRSIDNQISRREQSTIRIGRFFIYYTSFEQTRNPAKKSSLNVVIGVGMAHAPFCALLCPRVLPSRIFHTSYIPSKIP